MFAGEVSMFTVNKKLQVTKSILKNVSKVFKV